MSKKEPRILLMACGFAKQNVAPIGLFFLSGYLKYKGYTTKIIYLNIKKSVKRESINKKIKKEITVFNPGYIGYSFRNLFVPDTPYYNEIPDKLVSRYSVYYEKDIIDYTRTLTSAKIIGGGSGFSLAPILYMKYLNLDFGIVGEGEIAFEALIHKLENNHDYTDIPSLVYPNHDDYKINNSRQIENLQQLPKMDLGNLKGYKNLFYKKGGYASVQTKRGCDFGCIYCVYPQLEGTKYRLRNVEDVVSEIIDMKKKYNLKYFFIVDSIFSTPVQHSFDFCNELVKRNVNIKWKAHINSKGITKELLELYKKAGCDSLIFTPDTLSDKMLKNYNKKSSQKDIINTIKWLKDTDIPFVVELIIGGPGENIETLNETLEFCDKYLKNFPVMFNRGMWVHPKAPIYKIMKKEDMVNIYDMDEQILSNDYEAIDKLRYYFPRIGSNKEQMALTKIFKKIQNYKRVLSGELFTVKNGKLSYNPKLRVKNNQRPWHRGMKGRKINITK